MMKKGLSAALAAALLLTSGTAFAAGAEEKNTVHVTVSNDRFAVTDGAKWEGQLLDREVTLQEGDSMETVIERAISESDYSFTVSQYGYISSVNGLSEYDANGSGGWMAMLNNWFTASGTSDYTLENGGLQAGDEITVVYSCTWGADVGSLFGDYNTALSADFSVDSGAATALSPAFEPSEHTYTLWLTQPEDTLTLHASAENKNYQTRFYKNGYTPEQEGTDFRGGKNIPVKDGDVLTVGVGNPAWPTMNSFGGTAEETVYTFNVKTAVKGDLNLNGRLDIDDVTLLQRALAEYCELTPAQAALADVDGDGTVKINDCTAMQRILAEKTVDAA